MPLSRRQFLHRLGLALGGLGLSACGRAAGGTTTATNDLQKATPLPTATTPPLATAAPTITPTPSRLAQVAIGRCSNYDPITLRQTLTDLLDQTGLTQVVRSGDRVILKANLTGGAFFDAPDKPFAVDTYVTHPAVVGALAELCFDAGAKSVTVVDGLGDVNNWDAWGYTGMAASHSLDLVDLCTPAPYPDYTAFPVGEKYLVYPRFYLNPILAEADAFISVAKLKMHHTTGVTLALKNLVGLTPIEHYRRQAGDNNRSALHEEINGFDNRMPRVIVDLNLARPVHFALIDGIHTCEGAAGPWDRTLNPVSPGLLVAGRNPVAVDAVSAALMGVNPEGQTGKMPYLHGENHLALADQAGLGPHRLADIDVLGGSIQDLGMTFLPVP